jgi:acetoin utilization protein AcuB
MKAIPTIQKYMTVLPHTIGFDQTLEKAQNMMREYQIRHLPILKGGKLVGILSDRDIKLILSFADVDPKKITVDEAYTPDPYITQVSTSLDEVASHMAEHKYGCALVTDNNKLVGIFTEVDAMKALSELLNTRLKH